VQCINILQVIITKEGISDRPGYIGILIVIVNCSQARPPAVCGRISAEVEVFMQHWVVGGISVTLNCSGFKICRQGQMHFKQAICGTQE
jgi:hypothetical protein